MATFKLVISTPDGNSYAGEAVSLSLRGAEGDLAILAGHIPFATTVQPGQCHIETEDGTIRRGTLDGGLLTVSTENVTLLSGSFQWEEE